MVLGCMAEMTDLVVDGNQGRTIAIESEDPEAVMDAVRHAGLEGYLNINYEKGLKAIVGHGPETYAVIDAGTNSVKFHLAERQSKGAWKVVTDRAEVTRLGEGMSEGGHISPAAVDRTAEAITAMVDEAKSHGVTAIAAVGTAGLRMASNREEVVAEIRRRSGIDVSVISGEEESRLAYLAVKAGLGLDPGSLVVFDTGGGSTQFTFGRGDEVLERYSLNVGAVRYTERFGLDGVVSPEVLSRAIASVAEDLGLEGRTRPEALVGMGGTITNITAVSLGLAVYDPDRVQGATLERAEVDRQIEVYRTTSLEERSSIVGLQPKRAEVILAGACIVKTVMEKLGHESLTVSDRGLRHGLLAERFDP
jgi:exopolyphosphatase/guanosine-5'-triphosphate,3'-diphosphate pyrophosphatase